MKLGLFTPIFAALSFDELLQELKRYPEITALEIGCGGWSGDTHIDPPLLLGSASAAKEYRSKLNDAGLTISALSCHGNPVHPDPAIAQRDDAVFKQTVRLAETLEVPVVVTFSGCAGRKRRRQDTELDHGRVARRSFRWHCSGSGTNA